MDGNLGGVGGCLRDEGVALRDGWWTKQGWVKGGKLQGQGCCVEAGRSWRKEDVK